MKREAKEGFERWLKENERRLYNPVRSRAETKCLKWA
jgi:hypothetical protein